MTDFVKDARKAAQNIEAKIKTDMDHAKGKPGSDIKQGKNKNQRWLEVIFSCLLSKWALSPIVGTIMST